MQLLLVSKARLIRVKSLTNKNFDGRQITVKGDIKGLPSALVPLLMRIKSVSEPALSEVQILLFYSISSQAHKRTSFTILSTYKCSKNKARKQTAWWLT